MFATQALIDVIQCPHCESSFSPSFKCCPRCKNYITPIVERRKYLKRRAEELATEGCHASDIRDFLINEGLPDIDTDIFLRDSMTNVRSENRSFGCLRLMSGLAMTISGGLVCAALCASLTQAIPVRLNGSAIVAFLVVGPMLVVTGVLAILSGLYSTTTGR